MPPHLLPRLPSPLANDISAMLQSNMADISIKQGGWDSTYPGGVGRGVSYPLSLCWVVDAPRRERVGVRVIPFPGRCHITPLTQLVHMCYILPKAPTPHVGPNQGKDQRSPMSRNSLNRPRHPRAVWDRPAPGTRLLPIPSSFHPLGDGRSIDFSRHTLLYGHSRVSALSERRSAPATATGAREGLWPDNVGSPEAIAPRVYSTVARPGEHISPGDGSEDALPLLRMAERKWDLFPLLDSPVVSLGDPLRPSSGVESALPSLRMVERVPCMDMPNPMVQRVPCTDIPHREMLSGLVQTSKGCWGGLGPMYSPLSPESRTFHRLPLVHCPIRDDRPVALGVGAPNGASTPLPSSSHSPAHPVGDAPRREQLQVRRAISPPWAERIEGSSASKRL